MGTHFQTAALSGSGERQNLGAVNYFEGIVCLGLRDWSLITGRGGLQNGKIAGPKLVAPPPPSRQGKFFPPPSPPFKGWKPFAPSPPSIWLKLQTPVLKLPQNFFVHPPHFSIVVIRVKIFPTETAIEIQLVRPIEVCGKVLSMKNG